jgi:hypothetical protein
VEAAPLAESLFKKDGVEGVGRKISVNLVCEDLELVPHELSLLLGSGKMGQVLT